MEFRLITTAMTADRVLVTPAFGRDNSTRWYDYSSWSSQAGTHAQSALSGPAVVPHPLPHHGQEGGVVDDMAWPWVNRAYPRGRGGLFLLFIVRAGNGGAPAPQGSPGLLLEVFW